METFSGVSDEQSGQRRAHGVSFTSRSKYEDKKSPSGKHEKRVT